MAGYTRAFLSDSSPLAADAVTLSPYLGVGALHPAFEAAVHSGRGIFVLALTSNPEGAAIQHCRDEGGYSVAQQVIHQVGQWNQMCDFSHMGPVGVVIGATIGTALNDLQIDPALLDGPILAPGIGAQGGGSEQVEAVFGSACPFVLASTSRAALECGPSVSALREAHSLTAQSLLRIQEVKRTPSEGTEEMSC